MALANLLREFVGGSSRSGAYVTSVDCKSRVESMHGVRAVAQHIAELLGGLQSTGIDTGEGPFVVVLICFAQSKMAVNILQYSNSFSNPPLSDTTALLTSNDAANGLSRSHNPSKYCSVRSATKTTTPIPSFSGYSTLCSWLDMASV